MTRIKFSNKLLIILILVLVFLPYSATTQELPKETIRIGVLVPLTGGSALGGEDVKNLLPIIEKQINSNSKKYNYKFLIEDSKCGVGNDAINAANKFIALDHVKYIITGCSGETLAIGPVAQRSQVVLFATQASHRSIKSLGEYIFRTFVDVERGVEKISNYIKAKGGNRLILVTEEVAFTAGIHDLLNQHLSESIIFSERVVLDTADFNSLIAKIKSKTPDSIFLNTASDKTLIKLVNQLKSRGVHVPIYSYWFPEVAGFREATNKNSDGIVFIGTPHLSESSSDFKNTLNKFIVKYKHPPNSDLVVRAGFDAIMSIVNSIEAVGNNSELVQKHLQTYSKPGALGMVEFDENGDVKNIDYALKKIDNRGVVVVINNY